MRNGEIRIRDAGVSYRLYREKVTTLKEAVVQRFRHLRSAEMFWALRKVSLERRRRIHAVATASEFQRTIGELGRLRATERFVAQGERQQYLPQELGRL